MGQPADFVVFFNSKTDSTEDISKRILYSLIVRRLKNKKPTVCFFCGGSGEGKSISSIKFQEIVLETQGLDINEYFDDINIVTPLQYATKIDKILHDKKLKKVNVITMHEAREIINSKDWRSFLSRAVADVNSMSRAVKPMAIFIVSQSIRDITLEMRYTLNFYIKLSRPRGRPARAYISKMWQDERSLEAIKLRKRRIRGFLVDETGRYISYCPKFLELSLPPKDLVKRFVKLDKESKSVIIRHKLSELISKIKADIGDVGGKVDSMVEWYLKHSENLGIIGRQIRGKFRLHKGFKESHDLTPQEAKSFVTKLNNELTKRGINEEETGEGN